MYRVIRNTWPCVSGNLQSVSCPMSATVQQLYTSIAFYKAQEQHGHVDLVGMYLMPMLAALKRVRRNLVRTPDPGDNNSSWSKIESVKTSRRKYVVCPLRMFLSHGPRFLLEDNFIQLFIYAHERYICFFTYYVFVNKFFLHQRTRKAIESSKADNE